MMPSRAAASSLLPRLSTPVLFSSRFASLHIRQLSLPLLPKVSMAIPAISLNLPSLPSLQEIWDGLLKAVPKKKVSHSKRRHRQMAGKALKDTTSLCRCPACGNVKRMHYLCSPCAGSKPLPLSKTEGKGSADTVTRIYRNDGHNEQDNHSEQGQAGSSNG